jgi:hypothetical protein
MSQAPISPLRRRMIEDMTVRGFGEKTQSDYIRHVKNSPSSSAARRIRHSRKICACISCISASRVCSRRR